MSTSKKFLTGKKLSRSKSKFSAIKVKKENTRKSKVFFENVIKNNKKSKMKNPFVKAKKVEPSPFKDVTNKTPGDSKFYSC